MVEDLLRSIDDDGGSDAEDIISETVRQVSSEATAPVGDDFTMIPKFLDQKLQEHDVDGAMKSVILSADREWDLRHENFLSRTISERLHGFRAEAEKKKATDLLDAISRSGELPIDAAELHVVVGVAHCFDKSIMMTVIQDNVNPILSRSRCFCLRAPFWTTLQMTFFWKATMRVNASKLLCRPFLLTAMRKYLRRTKPLLMLLLQLRLLNMSPWINRAWGLGGMRRDSIRNKCGITLLRPSECLIDIIQYIGIESRHASRLLSSLRQVLYNATASLMR